MSRDTIVLWLIGAALILLDAAHAPARAQIVTAADSKPPTPLAAARPQLPPGQVFECLNNGQRIFSDAPCGPHASIRQLNDLNIMDRSAAAPIPAYRSYGYQPPVMEPQIPDEAPSEIASDSYAVPGFIVVRERARRDHFPRHGNPPRARPRRN